MAQVLPFVCVVEKEVNRSRLKKSQDVLANRDRGSQPIDPENFGFT